MHDTTQLTITLPAWQADSDNRLDFYLLRLQADTDDPRMLRLIVKGCGVSFEVPTAVLAQGLHMPAECEELRVIPGDDPDWLLWTLPWNPEEPLTLRVPRLNVEKFLDMTLAMDDLDRGGDWDAAAAELIEQWKDNRDGD
ncbi:hypothetical protein AB0C10_15645 [Microbispora amethystogenes]|uniref:hypothetical protein n=1 Tax=Microbispora amethystogenes TaxID=1427754 RepID=UPI00340407E8